MKRYRISRVLSPEDVRQVCINNRYYTRGDSRAYENMFSMLENRTKHSGSNITAYKLQEIAEDIKDHSDTEDTVEDIMSYLAVHITCSLFIKEEE